MALTRDSALLLWGARHGLAPLVGGGDAALSRDGGGTIIGRQGGVHLLPARMPRVEWVTVGDEVLPALLLERGVTNGWTHAEALSDPAWIKQQATVVADAALAPDGKRTADKLVEDATAGVAHRIYRESPAHSANAWQTASFHARAAERGWVAFAETSTGSARRSYVNLTTGEVGTKHSAHTVRVRKRAHGGYRVAVTFVAGNVTSTSCYVEIAQANGVNEYTGDGSSGIYLWGFQWDADSPGATSYISTGGSPASRPSEFFHLPAAPPPQALIAYLRIISAGSESAGRLLNFGESGAPPRLLLYRTSTALRCYFDNGAAALDQAVGVNPGADVAVEMWVVLEATGGLQVIVSLDGAPVSASAVATPSAGTLPSAWSGDGRLWMGSQGTDSPTLASNVHLVDVAVLKLGDVVATTAQGRADEVRGFVFDPSYS